MLMPIGSISLTTVRVCLLPALPVKVCRIRSDTQAMFLKDLLTGHAALPCTRLEGSARPLPCLKVIKTKFTLDLMVDA
jgi:hypothetical protein